MLLPLQVGCSKLASKARQFLLHYKLPETRCEKNASTNGGDASRVGFFSSLVPCERCNVHTQNKGSQTVLITRLSVSLCLKSCGTLRPYQR